MTDSRRPLMLDACTLVNVLATRCAVEILGCHGRELLVVREAWEELLPDRHGRLLDELAGAVSITELVASEMQSFVRLSHRLGNGEAASLAAAHARGCTLATDDRPGRAAGRLLLPPVELMSTPELLQPWAATVPASALVGAIRMIERDASYHPPGSDPLADWWRQSAAARDAPVVSA